MIVVAVCSGSRRSLAGAAMPFEKRMCRGQRSRLESYVSYMRAWLPALLRSCTPFVWLLADAHGRVATLGLAEGLSWMIRGGGSPSRGGFIRGPPSSGHGPGFPASPRSARDYGPVHRCQSLTGPPSLDGVPDPRRNSPRAVPTHRRGHPPAPSVVPQEPVAHRASAGAPRKLSDTPPDRWRTTISAMAEPTVFCSFCKRRF